jgi:hypothetical protein
MDLFELAFILAICILDLGAHVGVDIDLLDI